MTFMFCFSSPEHRQKSDNGHDEKLGSRSLNEIQSEFGRIVMFYNVYHFSSTIM